MRDWTPQEVEGWILEERDGLIVVNKPAGVTSTGRTLEDPDCVQFALMQYFRRRKIWAVHQLDKETTGVNLFVRRKALVQQWSERLSDHGTKRYLAICQGLVSFEHKHVDAPIGWIEHESNYGVTSEGKEARSEIKLLGHGQDASLLEITLHTGRTHQIRVHLAHLGHPLLGESRYVDPPCARHDRQALHAARIEFDDGSTTLEAPQPSDFVALCKRLGLSATR